MDRRKSLSLALILALVVSAVPSSALASVVNAGRAGVQARGFSLPLGGLGNIAGLQRTRLGTGSSGLGSNRPGTLAPTPDSLALLPLAEAQRTSPLLPLSEVVARGGLLNLPEVKTAGVFGSLRFALDKDGAGKAPSDEGAKQDSDKIFDNSAKTEDSSAVAGASGSGADWLRRAWSRLKTSARAPVETFGKDEHGGPKRAKSGLLHRALYGAKTGLKMVGIGSIATLALSKLSALFPWQLHVSDAVLRGTGRIELMTQVGPEGIIHSLAASPFDFFFKAVPLMATLEEISYRVLGFGALFLALAAIKPLAFWGAKALKKLPELPMRTFLERSLGWLSHLSRFAFPVAAVVSAAAFAIGHLAAWGVDPVTIGVQFIMGLVLARAAYKTRSLLVTVVAHSVYNILSLLGLMLALHYAAPLAGSLVGIAVALAGIAALYYDLRMRAKARRAAGPKAGLESPAARVAKRLALPLLLLGYVTFTQPSFTLGPGRKAQRWHRETTTAVETLAPKDSTTVKADTTALLPLPDLVEKLTPSVVKILVPRVGSGSGYIIDASGRIATNSHVAEMAGKGGEVVIIFADGKQEVATVLDLNKETDIAFLQLPSRTGGWPAVPFGDSDKLRAGEPVITMGYPLGEPLLVSQGIVSNHGSDTTLYVDMITVDAAINHGNSGGPLFNLRGEVVGMNSAIVTTNDGFLGIGKSISSADILRSLAQYDKTGNISTAYMGIIIDVVNVPESGVLIDQVRPGSPAWDAGLRPGDVILGVDGEALPPAIETGKEPILALMRTLGKRIPGQKLVLEVLHVDRTFAGRVTRTVTLESKAPPTPE